MMIPESRDDVGVADARPIEPPHLKCAHSVELVVVGSSAVHGGAQRPLVYALGHRVEFKELRFRAEHAGKTTEHSCKLSPVFFTMSLQQAKNYQAALTVKAKQLAQAYNDDSRSSGDEMNIADGNNSDDEMNNYKNRKSNDDDNCSNSKNDHDAKK
ncbi:hypothetical protein HPB51_015523 [Rhipicephalus microplus]|uniref:Uncharacterized protein n=1 Tax=Rhipicephalus microplus TaxID=6941 RepID=A0A9J6ENH1_RHIMP|nr:hypothetical protein HPB51_015523 [Rhipicephalus microplus]